MDNHESNPNSSGRAGCRHGRGPSSYHMHDQELVFSNLNVDPGDIVLDLGCGPGDYALRLAGMVQEHGKVYALDKWDEVIDRVGAQRIANLIPKKHDITKPLPFDDGSVDFCLMATVLHSLDREKHGQAVFNEVRRVLRPGGELAIIECKKEEQPWGPPIERRLGPEQVETLVAPCGFARSALIDLGYMYLIKFQPGTGDQGTA